MAARYRVNSAGKRKSVKHNLLVAGKTVWNMLQLSVLNASSLYSASQIEGSVHKGSILIYF